MNQFSQQVIYDDLLHQLQLSSLGYVRHSLHESNSDQLHVMVMLLKPYTSVLPHKSMNSGYNYYLVLRGSVNLYAHSNSLNSSISYELDSSLIPCKVDKTRWRILTNCTESPCLYVEITDGPFVPNSTCWYPDTLVISNIDMS